MTATPGRSAAETPGSGARAGAEIGVENGADARTAILSRLRAGLVDPSAAFKAPELTGPRTEGPAPITEAPGDRAGMVSLFGARMDAVLGSHEVVTDARAALDAVARKIQAWRSEARDNALSFERCLAWAPDALGVDGLAERLAGEGVSLTVPDDLHDGEQRANAARTAIGITGVAAAFASTGTVVLDTGPGRSRAASLLPLYHIVLIPTNRLHPTPEAWLGSLRSEGRLETVLRKCSQLALVTGPSKSADIELTLTLGVHGPRAIHAILYEGV